MTNLATFIANASDLRVMRPSGRGSTDIGAAATHFGPRLALVQIGDSQGADATRGAYDWHPLTIGGALIGELRDDATGLTIHLAAVGASAA